MASLAAASWAGVTVASFCSFAAASVDLVLPIFDFGLLLLGGVGLGDLLLASKIGSGDCESLKIDLVELVCESFLSNPFRDPRDNLRPFDLVGEVLGLGEADCEAD